MPSKIQTPRKSLGQQRSHNHIPNRHHDSQHSIQTGDLIRVNKGCEERACGGHIAVAASEYEGTEHQERGSGREGNSESTEDKEDKRTARDEEVFDWGAEMEA